jgi:hypothetical protein
MPTTESSVEYGQRMSAINALEDLIQRKKHELQNLEALAFDLKDRVISAEGERGLWELIIRYRK